MALGVFAGLTTTPSFAQTQIYSVAGSGLVDSTGDGGAATLAGLNYPRGLTALPDGGFLVTEAFGDRVRRVTPDGKIVPFAGSGVRGFSGDGGPATAAKFNLPHGTVRLPDGRVLIADTNNFRIRQVGLDGQISTVAGTGSRAFSGDGGPATAAAISAPRGIGGTADGGYLIADSDNNRVRKVSPAGTITTVAGNGTKGFGGDGGPATAAALNAPYGVSALPDGSFYIADSSNHRIRRVAPDGTISTVAGTASAGFSGDAGPAALAKLDTPHAVEATPDGRLLIADMGNHRVREVGTDGIIRTVVGTGTAGFSGEAGSPAAAKLFYPKAVLSFGAGFLVADSDNNRVRYIGPSPWPTPALGSGIVFVNGGETYTKDPLVSAAAPADDVSQVRISNSPAVTGGVLTSGTTYTYATPLAWDMADAATGGSMTQGTRLVYVQWNRGGSWSPVVADSIVLDTVAPTTTATATAFTVGSTLGSALATTPIPMVTTWSGADATSGIGSYDLRATVDGGAPAISSTTGTTANQSLVAGKQYSYDVRATDRAANTGAWATGAPLSLSLTQDSDPALAFTGTWVSAPSGTASAGTTRSTSDPSATVTFSFTGRSVAWVAPLSAASGSANVQLDGVDVGTVSLNAPAPAARRIVYAADWPTAGPHTLKIQNAGATTQIDVDAFVVAGSPAPAPVDTTAPDTTITSGRAGASTASDASFGFSASEPGASFECKLDGSSGAGGTWAGCSSPKGYSALAPGDYTFSVRATDVAGNADASPATRPFTVQAIVQPDPSPPDDPGGAPPVPDPRNPEIVARSSASRASVTVHGSFTLAGVAVECMGEGPDCAGATSVVGTVASASGTNRSVKLGGSTLKVSSGKTLRVKSSLTRKGLRLLKRAKRMKALVTIKIKRGALSATRTVKVTLAAPKR